MESAVSKCKGPRVSAARTATWKKRTKTRRWRWRGRFTPGFRGNRRKGMIELRCDWVARKSRQSLVDLYLTHLFLPWGLAARNQKSCFSGYVVSRRQPFCKWPMICSSQCFVLCSHCSAICTLTKASCVNQERGSNLAQILWVDVALGIVQSISRQKAG